MSKVKIHTEVTEGLIPSSCTRASLKSHERSQTLSVESSSGKAVDQIQMHGLRARAPHSDRTVQLNVHHPRNTKFKCRTKTELEMAGWMDFVRP